MSNSLYGKPLIDSLIKLSGAPNEEMLDFLIAIIKSHNLAPDLITLSNMKAILEKEIQNLSEETIESLGLLSR
jgi:hypothetical protein